MKNKLKKYDEAIKNIDDILIAIGNSDNKVINQGVLIDRLINTSSLNEEDVLENLEYLHQEGLIWRNDAYTICSLTAKGIIHIKRGGKKGEIKREKLRLILDILFPIGSLLLLTATMISTIATCSRGRDNLKSKVEQNEIIVVKDSISQDEQNISESCTRACR